MNWKTALAVFGGLLGIVCGEAVKQNLTHWGDLTNFVFWVGVGIQVAGLIAVYTGGLFTKLPQPPWDGVDRRIP